MSKSLNQLQPYASLLLRLLLGVAMVVPGYHKVFPHGSLAHFEQMIHSLGMPTWLGAVSAFTELIGGTLLILGLLTRLAAFMVAVNLAVALATVTTHHGYTASQYPLALFGIAAALICYGAGALALDERIGLD
ncbi:MAG: DoxX family protein [Acidobacteriaceae bacterium]